MIAAPRTAPDQIRIIGVVFGAWTVVAFMATSFILVRAEGTTGWWRVLLGQLPSWWLWAGLTPVVLSASRRFPIYGAGSGRAIGKHVLVGIGVVTLYTALEAPFAILREGRVVTLASWTSAIGGGLAFRFLTHFITYFGIVGASQAFWATKALQERDVQAARLEGQLAEARLGTIRAQLQPHFLFNTLHAIGGLVRQGESERSVRMIAALSQLLRHSLERVKTPSIPLHAEFEVLERYIEIEEVRFGDRLEVVRQIESDVTDVLVPAFILQPLVENAIRHGIESRVGAGLVEIKARREGEMLLVEVSDDGVGVPEGFDPTNQHGVGLRFATERLHEHFGGAAQLTVTRASQAGGTVVRVLIPLRPSEPLS